MNKYLFLDIDGVLNDKRVRHSNGYHGTDPACVERLNQIIVATNPMIVISSSWRKEVHRGDMTLIGFEKMLLCHGVDCEYRVVGVTDPDEYATSRGGLITAWLFVHAPANSRYLILDDGEYWKPRGQRDHGIITSGHGTCFVQTNYSTGLTEADVAKAIDILNGHQASWCVARRSSSSFSVPMV